MHGPFQLGTGYRFADFTDGLTSTLLVGEKQVAAGRHGVGWSDCSLYDGAFPQCSTRAASQRGTTHWSSNRGPRRSTLANT